MKRLLLSLLCLAGMNARSQDYIPLLNDNSWYVNFYAFLAVNEDNQWVAPVGDITFNDTIYTHYQESYSLNPNMPQQQNDYYIREDIDEKRVYTRINGQEQLLYDFSLEVGDEVSTLVDGESLYTFAVVAKDSFAVDSGRKRVRLFLEDTSEWGSPVWEEWIEGIGSRDHPLKNFELLMPDVNYQVLCNHYGDEIPYSVSQFNGEPFTCPGSEAEPEEPIEPEEPEEPVDPDPVDPENPEEPLEPEPEPVDPELSVNEFSSQQAVIYPNPFSESFVIITEQPLYNATLTLHDVLGRVIREMPVNGSEIEVSRANLPKGIYLLRIVQDGKPAITKKIIAE